MRRDSSYLIGNKHALGNPPNRTSFRKGHRPWNKGVKGIHMSPQTEFKKGQPSLNHCPVGAERLRRRNRRGEERFFVKVAEPNVWEERAKVVWQKHYGKLIYGDIVHHINGNSLDDWIENLVAMPRRDHPRFHGRWGLKEIAPSQMEKFRRRYWNKSQHSGIERPLSAEPEQ